MVAMRMKRFFVGFVIIFLLSVIIEALVLHAREPGSMGLTGYIGLVMYAWCNETFFIHLFLFSVYFFVSKWLMARFAIPWQQYLALALWAFIFFATIVIDDWNLSRRLFPTFQSYLSKGNHYLLFAITVITVCTIMELLTAKRKINKSGAVPGL